MSVKILIGDCREVLRTLPDASVQAIVTSPPYWNLRDYGVNGQIGLEDSVDAWVAELVTVFREARRVLAEDGVAWINLGDSYAANRGYQVPDGKVGNVGNARGMKAGPSTGLKPKDLIGQPWRVAFALQADGWWWRDTIVFHKANPMPESVTDRCTKAWEPVLMMTKAARYYFDAEAIKEPASEGTHERYAAAKGKPFGMSNWNRGDGARDAVTHSRRAFKTPDGWDTSKGGGGHGSFHKEGREKGRVRDVGVGHNVRPRKGAPNGSGTKNNASFDAAMAVMPERRNKRNVWTIASEPFKESHFATFPTALVEPCVLASTRPGDTVLDPFGGAGTTGLVADRLQRNAILVELNPQYAEMARRRIHGDAPLFADVDGA